MIRYDRLVDDLTARLADVGIAFDGELPRAKQLDRTPTASTGDLLDERHVALIARSCAAEIALLGWQPPAG